MTIASAITGKKIRNEGHSKIFVDSYPGIFHIMERESHQHDIVLSTLEAKNLAEYILTKIEIYERHNEH